MHTRKEEHHNSEEELRSKPGLGSKLRLGFIVFGVLLILEIGEYILGTAVQAGNWPYMALLAVLAAAPIVIYYMHVTELWRGGE